MAQSEIFGQAQMLEQRLALSQRQIQNLKILQMGAKELSDYLYEYQLENPVVEVEPSPAAPDDRAAEQLRELVGWLNQSPPPPKQPRDGLEEDAGRTLEPAWNHGQEAGELLPYLKNQLDFSLNRPDLLLLDYLFHSLDRSGYLTCSHGEIAAATGLDQELVQEGIAYLQSLDPPGIGARDLRECLCIQLRRKGIREEAAYRMVQDHLEDLAAGKFGKIAKSLGISPGQARSLGALIRQLNPRPAAPFGGESTRYIEPDLLISQQDGELRCTLRQGDAALRISQTYLNFQKDDPEAYAYVNQKITQAMWVIQALEKRRGTLQAIGSLLIERQRGFFTQPHGPLRPMTLRELAKALGVHESTAGRAVRDKYLLCGRGVFPLKYFFSQDSSGAGGQQGALGPVSRQEVRSLIRRLILEEDRHAPLSDGEIAELLARQGIRLSRRAVTKYRSELGIPPVGARRR